MKCDYACGDVGNCINCCAVNDGDIHRLLSNHYLAPAAAGRLSGSLDVGAVEPEVTSLVLPVESAPFFVPSTSFCSLSSRFTSYYTYHLITVFALTICH